MVYGGWTLITAIPEIAVAGGSMAPILTERVMSFMTRGGEITFNGGTASIPLERSIDWISQVPDLVQSLAATAGTIFLWKTAVDLMDDVMGSVMKSNSYEDYEDYYDNPRPRRQKMGKPKGNMSGNNQNQNKQFKSVVVLLELTKDQARQLHDYISGRGYGYKEILEAAYELFDLK